MIIYHVGFCPDHIFAYAHKNFLKDKGFGDNDYFNKSDSKS